MLKHGNILIKQIEDISIGDFLALQKATTDHETLKLLCGESIEYVPADGEALMSRLLSMADSVIGEVRAFMDKPYRVEHRILSTTINLPKDTKAMPYWPVTYATGIIKQMGKEPFNAYEHYLDLVGHYTYSLVTGKTYNEYEAEQFCKDIADTNFRTIIQMGDFFLNKHRSLWLPKASSLNMNLMMRRLKLASTFSTSTMN